MRGFTALAALSILLFAFGCAQSSLPQACSALPAEKMPNCAYVSAVLEQNPFYCYSLPDPEQRATCIRDSSGPVMKSELERSSQSQRDSIFAPSEAQVPPAATQPPATQDQTQPPAADETVCMEKQGGERDSCLSAYAIGSKAISHCAQIVSQPLRESCITQIAKSTRDMESCEQLEVQADYEICRSYSQGEVQ
ncbi:MAG: hypothetical protein WC588_02315 [Candidatus Micrarchaeia archaeon]